MTASVDPYAENSFSAKIFFISFVTTIIYQYLFFDIKMVSLSIPYDFYEALFTSIQKQCKSASYFGFELRGFDFFIVSILGGNFQ